MFAYPVFLWFMPLLGLVVLIHLINMFRHRRVPWAAVEFLLAGYRKSRLRILLQQLLLMLLRTLAVATVILMVAQPEFGGSLVRWIGGGTTHHLVLLDDSFSMNDRNVAQAGSSLFDETLSVLRQIVDSAVKRASADRFTLLRLSKVRKSDHGTADIDHLLLDEKGARIVSRMLDSFEPSQSAAGPEELFQAVLPMLRSGSSRMKPVVYFLSDFRQRNWTNNEPTLKKLEEIRERGAAVRLIRAGNDEHSNLAVKRLEPVDGIHAADIDLLLDAAIVNFGREDAENVHLQLRVDDRPLPGLTIPKIAPGEETIPPLRFPVRLDGPGRHRIEVQLQGDAVPDDNSRFFILDVPASLEILLIAPDGPVGDADSPVPYVRVALSPGGTRSGIATRVESPSFLTSHPLETFGAVFLLDVPGLEPSAVSALEQYVAAGGGLAIFPGSRTDFRRLQTELYRDGSGLFPFAPSGIASLEVDYLSRMPDIVSMEKHPIFRLFEDDGGSLISNIKIERYVAVEREPASAMSEETRILASLRNGAPLLVEKRFGQGKTISLLTSASPVWNNWARGNPSFVVVMLELAAWLSRRSDRDRTFSVGETIPIPIDTTTYEPSIRIQTPSETTTQSEMVRLDGVSTGETTTATFEETSRSGIYEIVYKEHSGAEIKYPIAVNIDAAEGDLRLADVSDLSEPFRRLGLSLESAAGFSSPFEFSGDRPGSDLLLGLLLVLLIAETFLAGRLLPPSKRVG